LIASTAIAAIAGSFSSAPAALAAPEFYSNRRAQTEKIVSSGSLELVIPKSSG
jgi:hypothetical protein